MKNKNTIKVIWLTALILQIVVLVLKLIMVFGLNKPLFEEFNGTYFLYVISIACLFLASKDDFNKDE